MSWKFYNNYLSSHFNKDVSWQIAISLEVYCSITFEIHMLFSRCLFQLETTFFFEVFFVGKALLHKSLFQDDCFSSEPHYCLKDDNALVLGNVNNCVWTSFFMTIQIVHWSAAAILLKHVCLLKEYYFNWEM